MNTMDSEKSCHSVSLFIYLFIFFSWVKKIKYGPPCFVSGVFDVLAYTDKDVAVPFTWIESDPKLIANPQMVKLHSFDTKVRLQFYELWHQEFVYTLFWLLVYH